MKVKFFLVFVILLISNFLFAAQLEINVIGKSNRKVPIKIIRYHNPIDSEIFFQDTLNALKVYSIDINIKQESFISVNIGHPSEQNLIDVFLQPTEKCTVVYDTDKRKIISIGEGNSISNQLFKLDNAINWTPLTKTSDSLTYVSAFFNAVNTLDSLDETLELSNIAMTCIKRKLYCVFSNNVRALKPFFFFIDENNKLAKTLRGLIDLSDFQPYQNAQDDYFTLRMYHINYAPYIFKDRQTDEKIDLAWVLNKGNKWANTLPYSEQTKQLILGDFYWFYLQFKYEFTDEAIPYLENFCKNNPQSAYTKVFLNELDKRKKIDSGNLKLEMECENSEGEKLDLKKIPTKLTYIDFWATWCRPCLAENPSWEKLKQDYKDKITFIKVSIDMDYVKWGNYVQKNEADLSNSFHINEKNKEKVWEKLGFGGIPRFLLVNNEGVVINIDAPRPSNPKIRELLNELLKEK